MAIPKKGALIGVLGIAGITLLAMEWLKPAALPGCSDPEARVLVEGLANESGGGHPTGDRLVSLEETHEIGLTEEPMARVCSGILAPEASTDGPDDDAVLRFLNSTPVLYRIEWSNQMLRKFTVEAWRITADPDESTNEPG